jgi:hypothetical protein
VGANLGATRADDFPCPADECALAAGDHARSRTNPDDAERNTGIYGSEGCGSNCLGHSARRLVGEGEETAHSQGLGVVGAQHPLPLGQVSRLSEGWPRN